MNQPKIIAWDIESGLTADFSNMLVFGYREMKNGKWGKTQTLSITDLWDRSYDRFDPADESAVKDFLGQVHEILSDADIWVTYFGKGFDWKMMNSWVLENGLPPLPPVPHIDLYFTVKSNMHLARHRMQDVAEYMHCPVPKTPIRPRVWRAAFAGHRDAVEKYIQPHCHNDIGILTWLYDRLRPYVRMHPVMHTDFDRHCRFCGLAKLQARGYAVTASSKKPRKQRVQCSNCGAWDLRPRS